jgi:predicted RNA binding protein YcfA (HicA-like mRNA interferase family)
LISAIHRLQGIVDCVRLAPSLVMMARTHKLLGQILRGDADANIPFSGMLQLLKRLGFQERVKGSHHIFFREGIAVILNLQPRGNKCKPYQVKQVRNVIINNGLAGEADE